jgi:uncharacterized membrane protein YbaN (DUF454 family)
MLSLAITYAISHEKKSRAIIVIIIALDFSIYIAMLHVLKPWA